MGSMMGRHFLAMAIAVATSMPDNITGVSVRGRGGGGNITGFV